MTELAILIPFASTDKYRLANLAFIQQWYAEHFPGAQQVVADDGGCRLGWTKARAIQNCIDQTDARVFVVADCDCICDQTVEAAQRVLSGEYEWASPHKDIVRLAESASEAVRNGATPHLGMKLDFKPYKGVAGGGICVVSRKAWETAPMDPRFKVTHGEDVAWSRAMKFLVGRPWRGTGALFHLWHPPIHATGERFKGNHKLSLEYRNATSRTIGKIIEEARAYRDPLPVAPVASSALVAVLVPVLGRPLAASAVMGSLRAAGDTLRARVYALTSPDDLASREAWAAEGATVLVSDRGSTFAQKVNYGYESTVEPWLLLIGDDVTFHPGWLDAALDAASDRYDVVSTNDLARKDLDELAVHPFIRRSYIENQGASFDGPGLIAHEGYKHWYVDREWSLLARERNTLVFAPDCKIEHHHPIWGKGNDDEIYKLGQSFANQDARTFRSRCNHYIKRVRRSENA